MKKSILGGLMVCVFGVAAQAQELQIQIAMKNHQFYPALIKVPANQSLRLVVTNMDANAEEFESKALGFEKIMPAGTRSTFFVPPLKAGTYDFFGEFHPATMQGHLVAQ
ncbi:MAG: cupredoxin domain-containing protein [Formosimonas sp.]